MPRFRNIETGSVVSVDDEKADRFKSGWEPVDDEKPRTPRAKKSE